MLRFRILTSRRLHTFVAFGVGALQVGGCVAGARRTPLGVVAPDSARADTVHVTTFGDSNTDWGVSADEPHVVAKSEGEVLGRAYPWSGGEPAGSAYPTGSIRRVEAYTPGPGDFVYVSMGTNDFADAGMSAAQTLGNLAWMIDGWVRAGHAPDHFVVTTLAPRLDRPELVEIMPTINDGVRHLAAQTGVGLIDLTSHTSADDGRTWCDPSMHLADRVHYTTPVRAWIAGQLVAYMATHQSAATR